VNLFPVKSMLDGSGSDEGVSYADIRMREAIRGLDPDQTALGFWRQQELVVLDRFVPTELLDRLRKEAGALQREVVRRQVGGFKRAGAVGYHALARRAPTILSLYRSQALLRFLSDLSELPLLTCPEHDPHACALYRYDNPGDHVGFHYDTSWYEGARFTVLIGLEDTSTSRLRCLLYSRDPHRPTRELDVATKPGTLVFFNGDKLLHAVTPLGPNQTRVVLSLQYVTNRLMRPWKRFVSNVKDSVAYFGFRGRPAQKRLSSAQRSEEAQ
jgi:hypothetical protein